MPTKILLLDTCFFVDHLRANLPETIDIFRQINHGIILAGFSIITDVELWAGVRNKPEERKHKLLLRDLTRYPLTVEISHHAGALIYQYGKAGFKDPGDAIIAATALRYNLPVCTRNKKHFDLIPGQSKDYY